MIESGEAELIVGNFPHPPGMLAGEVLSEDALIVALRRGHPALKRRFDLDAYLACEHLNVSLRGEASGGTDEALGALGRQRRVVATVGHFLVVPFLLMGSDLVATEPKRVMQRLAEPLGLALRPPPFAAPRPIGLRKCGTGARRTMLAINGCGRWCARRHGSAEFSVTERLGAPWYAKTTKS
jgi:DNA-binding transcriptional LysR family regulator